MADELISRQALYKIMENWRDAHADVDDADGCGLLEDVMCEVNAQTTVDAVSRGLYEQIKYERDAAMEQLAENGIAFGDKSPDVVSVCRCKDCEYFAESKGKDSGKSCGYGRCEFVSGIRWLVCADDFCSSALRREEDV